MKARNFERLVKAYISIFLPLQTAPPPSKKQKIQERSDRTEAPLRKKIYFFWE